ncbi:MAG: DUF2339 domain-containing protein, partial [Verrucomicrobiota bacterium]
FPRESWFSVTLGLVLILLQTVSLGLYRRWIRTLDPTTRKTRARLIAIGVLSLIAGLFPTILLQKVDPDSAKLLLGLSFFAAGTAFLSQPLRSWIFLSTASATALSTFACAITAKREVLLTTQGYGLGITLFLLAIGSALLLRRHFSANGWNITLRLLALSCATILIGRWLSVSFYSSAPLSLITAIAALLTALTLIQQHRAPRIPIPWFLMLVSLAAWTPSMRFTVEHLLPVLTTALGLLIIQRTWPSARIASSLAWPSFTLFLIGGLTYAGHRIVGQGAADSSSTAMAITLGGMLIVASILLARSPKTNPSQQGTALLWIYTLSSIAILFSAFAWNAFAGKEIATALWGVTGISIFLVGLILRLRPHRLTGLIALGLCVIRVFLVDVEDTFYRIIAFAAVSLLLLLIGFLYARFREHVEH